MQIVPISRNSLHVTVNGVQKMATSTTIHHFRLIFLFSFGGVAVILLAIGIFLLIRRFRKKKQEIELKRNGRHLLGENLKVDFNNVSVNNRNQLVLTCTYEEYGIIYHFKSKSLRYDPWPYLTDTVDVYQSRDDPKQYFVDVEGSMSAEVVEL